MGGTSGSVLVVDNEPDVCDLIRDVLALLSLDCVTATDPRQALDLLRRQEFSLLITDIYMPDISGLELLRQARQTSPHCKVILITGQQDLQNLSEALKMGAFDFLAKPFDLPQFQEAIARALSPHSSLQHLRLRAAKALQSQPQLQQTTLRSVHALVYAVEAKDPYTRRHSEHVRHYALSLAQYAGSDLQQLNAIRTAAILHDIGKISVPDHILTKPGRLTDDEFQSIRAHPAVGAEILSRMPAMQVEAQLVLHHHEKWDGSGYPNKVAGQAIPYAARIITVADCMDAMLMARTYKPALPLTAVLAELKRCAGTHFDPALAALAVEWCQRNPDQVIIPKPLSATGS